MKVMVYSTHGFDRPALERAAAGKHQLLFTSETLDENTANLANGCEAVALFTSDAASGAILEKLHQSSVHYIAMRTAGYDNVDVELARRLNIRIANVPASLPYSIAEHAATLLMTLNRKLFLMRELRNTAHNGSARITGEDLQGKTVGIVGTGTIGSAFARIMHGLGCNLLACDIKENDALKKETGLSYVSFDELCRSSDIISIHCPLNETTRHLFNRDAFLKMKKGTILINTAHCSIVRTADLLEAITNETISAVGLDVRDFENSIFYTDREPGKIEDHLYLRLRALPNVLITGCQAFLTYESLNGIAETIVHNLDEWNHGECCKNEIN